jgi:hypothetical protein
MSDLNLLWDIRCLCNLINNSTHRIITKEIEDKVQTIQEYPEINNATIPEKNRNLLAKVQVTYCGKSLVGPVQ